MHIKVKKRTDSHAGPTQFLPNVSPDVVDSHRFQLLIPLNLLVNCAFTCSQFPLVERNIFMIARFWREHVSLQRSSFRTDLICEQKPYFRSSITLACSFSSLMSTTLLLNFLPRVSITWFPIPIGRLGSMVSCSIKAMKWTLTWRNREKTKRVIEPKKRREISPRQLLMKNHLIKGKLWWFSQKRWWTSDQTPNHQMWKSRDTTTNGQGALLPLRAVLHDFYFPHRWSLMSRAVKANAKKHFISLLHFFSGSIKSIAQHFQSASFIW